MENKVKIFGSRNFLLSKFYRQFQQQLYFGSIKLAYVSANKRYASAYVQTRFVAILFAQHRYGGLQISCARVFVFVKQLVVCANTSEGAGCLHVYGHVLEKHIKIISVSFVRSINKSGNCNFYMRWKNKINYSVLSEKVLWRRGSKF